MKTIEQIETMMKATEQEIIYGQTGANKKDFRKREQSRENLKLQLGVLKWVLKDTPAASGATTMETEEKDESR